MAALVARRQMRRLSVMVVVRKHERVWIFEAEGRPSGRQGQDWENSGDRCGYGGQSKGWPDQGTVRHVCFEY